MGSFFEYHASRRHSDVLSVLHDLFPGLIGKRSENRKKSGNLLRDILIHSIFSLCIEHAIVQTLVDNCIANRKL